MPCTDLTDAIDAHFDLDDRLVTYTLAKRTCGAAAGEASLLLEVLRGHGPERLLAVQAGELVERLASPTPTLEFLAVKHLGALQELARVYTGASAGTPHDTCILEAISADDTGIHVRCLLTAGVRAGDVRACGGCGSCGSRRGAHSGDAKTCAQ